MPLTPRKYRFPFLILVVVLLVTSIPLLLCSPKEAEFQHSLDAKQTQIYKKIVKERKKIGTYSLIYGVLTGILMALLLEKYLNTSQRTHRVLIYLASVASFIFVAQKFYILYPKSTYMIHHLRQENQLKLWMDQYRGMQICFHGTMSIVVVLALFGVMCVL